MMSQWRSISLRNLDRRIIIGAALASVLLWVAVRSFVWRPLQDRWDRSSSINRQLSEIRQEVARGERAEMYCDRVATQSLSPDPVLVAHRYQEWLMKRTEELGTVSVAPLTPIEESSLGWRVPFTIEGDTTAEKLAELVDEIAESPLLHRVTYLSAEHDISGRAKTKDIRFTLTLEALALDKATDLGTVPPATGESRENRLAKLVNQTKPFSQGYFGPPPPVKPSDSNSKTAQNESSNEKPKLDPLSTLNLIGSVVVNGKPQAWIYDNRTKEEFYIDGEKQVKFDVISATVQRITNDYIDLEIEGDMVRWSMGTSLRTALSKTR